MVCVVGNTDGGLIYCKDNRPVNKRIQFSVTEFENSSEGKSEVSFSLATNASKEVHTEVVHISILALNNLNKSEQGNNLKDKSTGKGSQNCFHLIAITTKNVRKDEGSTFSGSIFFIQSSAQKSHSKTNRNCELECFVLEEKNIQENIKNEFRMHFLPKCSKSMPRDCEPETEDSEWYENSKVSFVSRMLVTTLEECIVLYNVESTLNFASGTHIATLNVLSSEIVSKGFWWTQWLPLQEAIAFAHFRQPRQSSFDDDDGVVQDPKPFLTVLQFHKDFPRESVLNMPLQNREATMGNIKQIKLIEDPNVLESNGAQLKLLAHPTGAVYLFYVFPESTSSTLKYSVHMLHHNKTLDVEVNLKLMQDVQQKNSKIRLDVGQYSRDQYLMVVGWPYFVHFLDVGSTHEPSHHFTFEWSTLMGQNSFPFLCIFNARNKSLGTCRRPSEDKTDLSPKYSTITNVVLQDMSHKAIELNSALLLPLMDAKKSDNGFKLAVLHHFLVHVGDINVAKRIIYDEGKKRGNLFLKQIYQEFLIGHAHLQAKKQILPNIDSYGTLIPYCADPDLNSVINSPALKIQLNPKKSDVSIMLLSPSQRVFPHNVVDLWTSLWHLNRNYSRSKRFNHKDIAEKLLLSLQCYKPEALSRASTPGPMSPSSPMICTSLGDIVGMFGRRATELQLPFVEHESCTANKQEYIFSINLREMSMHLLKERKELPLHGHTVAGKYVTSLGDSARLLCHLCCLTAQLQPTKNRDKGFNLVDTLEWDVRLKLFMLMEQYSLALTTLACPLPQGFTPFFAYLGYRVLKYDQFLWHVRAGTFDLQIDIVKNIMSDLKDEEEENVAKKLQLLSLLPKTRVNRIMNSWSHKTSVCLRARQHASDLLSGSVSQNRKRVFTSTTDKKKKEFSSITQDKGNALDTFFQLLTAKANASEIDLGLLTEATLISMEEIPPSSKR